MHLVEIGVLRPCEPTEWDAGNFIIPKKDGRVRWISDFQELNCILKHLVYLLPIIQDVMQRQTGYKWFTMLDISMFFYTLELDEESKELCTIVTPFGKSKYCRIAMGLKMVPNVAQAITE
eukprot:10457921-Ditylum_brightwellii.AAC.1